ncbi:ArsR family transcriptional regulator [Halorhabdus sp. CBA1104]|uniref:ArsR/SmtB family transcription factor n=1 Tax=unclassified Halorhabdus TaxID=2621901 RepID=UPI0012B2CB93|nr:MULTISPECIES: metalloregulator ArsR/SmtB family transcription factor [unclassified Halorhabdus]QGN06771.1 ArsR family transcriptional regulator [Halorhabdus sp. CBA1104]
MDSAELLDLLGNANRRRILRLLARKPCFVTEISDYLGVSPKAVIDHLRQLEEAGLVESRTDDRRRKYFYISRGFRLEVSASPYSFGTKTAYPASSGLDMASCRHLSIDVDPDGAGNLSELAIELRRLRRLQNELSLAQRWVQGRLTDVMEGIGDHIDDDSRIVVEVMAALADQPTDIEDISREVEVPPSVVEDVLHTLESRGVVEQDGQQWQLDG